MAGALQPFSIGWHPVDPGPGPRSVLLDDPPAPTGGNLPAEHQRWRAAVEADEVRLSQAHEAQPIWRMVALPPGVNVVPVYGGTPTSLTQVVTTMVTSGLRSGLSDCRVVNLSGLDLSGDLRAQMRGARSNQVWLEEVGARGSTVNLFGNPDPAEMLALLVDALRISAERGAGRQTQQARQELLRVAGLLHGRVTLGRVIAAVDCALGAPVSPGVLTIDEIRDLQDFAQTTVSQRRATQDRLADLHVDLEALRGFEKAPSRVPEVLGGGRRTVRWYDVGPGSPDEVELGRQLIARAVLQTFAGRPADELLVVAGAERLSDEVLDELVTSAVRLSKRLVLVYTTVSDSGRRMMGFAGSSVAMFLKMPNLADATAASDFLGREYTFVVNGISIAEGQTKDWSTSFSASTSHGTSRSRSSSSSSGLQGKALSFSRSVGSSVSSSFERGSSTTTGSGGSSSTTSTTSTGRVHEYVVEPHEFQKMPEGLMMIVGDSNVTVASCDNRIRFTKQVSAQIAVP